MKFLDHLEGIVSSRIEIAKGIWSLFRLEAKLAGSSIIPLLVSIGSLVGLIITLWLTGMLLIGYLIAVYSGGYVIAGIAIVLLLNVGFFVYTLKFLATNLQHMSFEKTRACLTNNRMRDADEYSKQPTSFDS